MKRENNQIMVLDELGLGGGFTTVNDKKAHILKLPKYKVTFLSP